VGCAGVDDTSGRVGDQGRRFAGRRVRQAQKHDVGCVHESCALGGILAALGIDAQHLDVCSGRQHLVNAQTRRAFLAIHEYLCRCHRLTFQPGLYRRCAALSPQPHTKG
jgi:hypothetical protein